MHNLSAAPKPVAHRPAAYCYYLLLALLLGLPGLSRAQVPAWAAALAPGQASAGGTASTKATAVNAAGDVLLTGSFTGTVSFGTTTLTSAGSTDVFVAKWNTAAGTWAWAVAGGGTGADQGQGIAVSGNNVYLTGIFVNNSANANSVQMGGAALAGASTTASSDVFTAKYTDAGSSASLGWAVAGGGTAADAGFGVAVSGSNVYVTGVSYTNSANANGVQFGGVALAGATATASNDLFLLKYTDAGSSATCTWAVAGGGTNSDAGYGVAVSGSGVYVTGVSYNNSANANGVQFGGVALAGASTTAGNDVLVAKYTDAGGSATYGWARMGGGTGGDVGNGVAVSGSSVYVTGSILNNTGNANSVQFGGVALPGATAMASPDVFLAKYTDGGGSATYGWAVAGGGTNSDVGNGVAVSGSSVYVTGAVNNNSLNTNSAQFGGVALPGVSATTSQDVLVAKYTDAGSSATYGWAVAGGGPGTDQGYGVAVSSSSVQVGVGIGAGVGSFVPAAAVGTSAAGRAALNPTTGAWQNTGTAVTRGGTSQAKATAVNAAGDVLLTGSFGGQLTFGTTTLTSAGSDDVFVAKWNTAAGTWAWAVAGGGTNGDIGYGLAVSGSSVYVTGTIVNSSANVNSVQFGVVALAGASTTTGLDVFVAKYTDAGSSAACTWAVAGGGTSSDYGQGVAVSGSNVYVAGTIVNSSANVNSVQFGGVALPGASATASQDVFLAKYTDAGSSATYGWAVAGGGTSYDYGQGVAVSGSNVYVTGAITNSTANANSVQFGGVALAGVGATAGYDVFTAKYTDGGGSATYGWAVAGGGTDYDYGQGVAVSGSNVYVAGFMVNGTANDNGVQFGGVALPGVSATAGYDAFAARYTDLGSSVAYGWAVAGGGASTDVGNGVAVGGSSVYVAGFINPPAAFGTTTLSPSGQAAFGAKLVDIPTLSSVSPAAELPGQVVTLTGANFSSGSTVSFGGTAASVSYVSATGLTAIVPAGLAAGSAPVSVTTGGLPTATQPFTVLEVYNGGAVGTCAAAVPATASVADGAWHYLLSSGGQVVAAYTYSGASLGTLSLDVVRADPAQPVRQDRHGSSYLDRNWHLTASGGRFDGRTVSLRFYGLNPEQARLQAADPTATLASLKATQYSGANEDCDLNNDDPAGEYRLLAPVASSQPSGAAWFAVELAVADHFSEFYLSAANTPLPVQLSGFTATAQGSRAVGLAWTTASEVSSARFEVERSPDGTTFGRVGTVPAAGSSATPRAYSLTDASLPAGATTLYYRLRQVDQDGTARYSPVRVVALAGGLALYPNPARGASTLSGAGAGTPVQVLDALGRVVATASADASGTAALPAGLPAGVYVVRAGSHALRLVVE